MILHPGDVIHLEYPDGLTPSQLREVERWYGGLGVTVDFSSSNRHCTTFRIVAVIRALPSQPVITDTPSPL